MNSRDQNVPATDETVFETKLAKAAVAPRITLADRDAQIVKEQYHVFEGSCLTTCVLTLKNGFTVSGESACASPENFDAQIGRDIAKRNAADKIWSHLGFELRTRLARIEAAPAMQERMAILFPEAKTYVGTKVVHGTPMKLGKYNDFRGWTMPNGEDPEAEGYLVEYTDGGKPNIQGFFGYVSWSPKDVFEGAYQVGFEPRKETYVDRMKQEYTRLVTDIAKLRTFIASSTYAELPREERDDQLEQVAAMVNHTWYLGRRLRRLGITLVSE